MMELERRYREEEKRTLVATMQQMRRPSTTVSTKAFSYSGRKFTEERPTDPTPRAFSAPASVREFSALTSESATSSRPRELLPSAPFSLGSARKPVPPTARAGPDLSQCHQLLRLRISKAIAEGRPLSSALDPPRTVRSSLAPGSERTSRTLTGLEVGRTAFGRPSNEPPSDFAPMKIKAPLSIPPPPWARTPRTSRTKTNPPSTSDILNEARCEVAAPPRSPLNKLVPAGAAPLRPKWICRAG